MVNDALFSSDNNFWETPQKLFDELDAEFHFTLDAAASDGNHKCVRCFVTRHTGAKKPGCGQRSAAVRDRSRAQRWCC